MKHLLKGNRELSISPKQHEDDAEMSGTSAKATVEMMRIEVGIRVNLFFFLRKIIKIRYTEREWQKWKREMLELFWNTFRKRG